MLDVVQNYKEDIAYEDITTDNGLPFFIDFVWDENETFIEEDSKRKLSGMWKVKRDKNKNIFIRSPKPPLNNPKYFPGDIILEFNNKKISDLSNKEVLDIFDKDYPDEQIGKKFELKILRKGKEILLSEEIKKNEYYFNSITFSLRDIELDVQKSQFTTRVFIELSSNFIGLNKFTEKHFVEDGESYGCIFNDSEIDIMQLPRVDDFIEIPNAKFIDKDNLQREHQIDSLVKEKTSIINSITKTDLEFRNNFQLRAFPFDKQVLNLKFVGVDTGQFIDFTDFTEQRITDFLKKVKIPGWQVLGYDLKSGLYQGPTYYKDSYASSIDINIEIQRSYQFYIFKIIIPIILILMICWSVLWIHPKELESRLTITIVCLLSLIAYNFVIEKDLPKLAYLTIMDYIILVSYFYATIPNFISILGFKLNTDNPILCEKIENYGKRFGPISYILIVFLIVLIAVNDNPYTARFLAGLI